MSLSEYAGKMANAPDCPVCGERGVPILYGLPTRVAREAAGAGKVRLFGCVVPAEPDQWSCRQSHTWRADDDEVLLAAIEAALKR
ncbi:hypothetical protein EV645_4270 [Kribbella rubisoli]|uniref:Uncharacterized protein n=1 Tax=Kribbella rubisoli TaxID=3075929 RepID=A0A4Q7WT14_9ACTN|nr:hypothetical protein EV645_4270 [Kribbella rubisoli]